jgi:hypothetical protein
VTAEEREMLLEMPAVQELLKEERERCAKIADKRAEDAHARYLLVEAPFSVSTGDRNQAEMCEAAAIAAAIRALVAVPMRRIY